MACLYDNKILGMFTTYKLLIEWRSLLITEATTKINFTQFPSWHSVVDPTQRAEHYLSLLWQLIVIWRDQIVGKYMICELL